MHFITSELTEKAIYNIFIGSVVPRPIAWVSTINEKGVHNLAPFSFFSVASANPPVLCFSPALTATEIDGKRIAVPKDTLRNIEKTGEFVVNMVSMELVEKMNQTSASYPPGVSEFEKAGLTPEPSQIVKPPRVAESMVSFECRLRQAISFGSKEGNGNLVLGDVVAFHFAEGVYENNHINMDLLHPVGRLAGTSYTEVGNIFHLDRPSINTYRPSPINNQNL